MLFGLSTSLEHESLADTRVIFGTNWGLKKYINDYLRNPEALKIIMQIFKDVGYIKGTLVSIKTFPNIIKVILDCKTMSRKWEVNPSEELLNTSLTKLRKEYNIKIIN